MAETGKENIRKPETKAGDRVIELSRPITGAGGVELRSLTLPDELLAKHVAPLNVSIVAGDDGPSVRLSMDNLMDVVAAIFGLPDHSVREMSLADLVKVGSRALDFFGGGDLASILGL